MTILTRTRMSNASRIESILDAALRLASVNGYYSLTLQQVAREADCSHGLVSHHFQNAAKMRKAVLRAAIDRRNLRVVLQGMVMRDPVAMRAPRELKQAAMATVMRYDR